VEEYGFELVFFRGVRGDRPPAYAAHFAVTDLPRQRFRYHQRVDVALEEGPGLPVRPGGSPGAAPSSAAGTARTTAAVGRAGQTAAPCASGRPAGVIGIAPPGGGFDLALGGWRMAGRDGADRLSSTMPGYALEVALQAVRPPALHLGQPPLQPGLISFGPAGYSYYYSRTRMDLSGTLEVDGARRPVRGLAWMDHQWGDFLVLGGGGWDWFAANLNDGRDVTLSLVRDAAGTTVLAYGTLVEPGGAARHLPPEDLRVEPIGEWTSPRTRVRYPSGWRVRLPQEGLDLLWLPLLEDQELDARPSSGVIYWEGATAVLDAATRADLGRGYVELTGYTER
jgi:predicted secreted hydrolase